MFESVDLQLTSYVGELHRTHQDLEKALSAYKNNKATEVDTLFAWNQAYQRMQILNRQAKAYIQRMMVVMTDEEKGINTRRIVARR